MSWYRSNDNGINPYATGTAKRQRTLQNDGHNQRHRDRCVLLFDMDCFYAQCERVRLGLPLDVKLCLFQWNSVLAVTYPAREHGIKRGDSWEDVATKSKPNASENKCYTIHLPILSHDTGTDVKEADCGDDVDCNENSKEDYVDDSIEASYRRIFVLSREEQLRCQRTENGVRRFHTQGKASLERYRLASMRIFAVVLESLQERITQQRGFSFILERASIDEFYLDLTDYCYCRNQKKNKNYPSYDCAEDTVRDCGIDSTVVAGRKNLAHFFVENETDDPHEIALNRACQVSNWIRQDIWNILGFTMSAGISTNKTMAKLAASYGKPNGQAVLYPRYFPNVLAETKITKVRNFGGKLGKTVLKLILQYQSGDQPRDTTGINDVDALDRLKSTATMRDLNQIPLPFLVQSKLLSEESAQFVFAVSQGIEHEEVKETSGALVKSITAFKSFVATKSHAEIFDRWLNLLANEIIERVGRDTARNKRYPKSCTLNYTYYTTSDGQRPSGKGSTRTQRQSRSLRLRYPSEREGTKQHKSVSLLDQAKEKLIPIIKHHPLRGIGLSVSNFIESSKAVHQASEGVVSIQSFFSSKKGAVPITSLSPKCSTTAEQGTLEDRESSMTGKPRLSMENGKVVRTTSVLTDGTATKRNNSECEEVVDYFPTTSSSRKTSIPESTAVSSNNLVISGTVNSISGQRNSQITMEKNFETLEDQDLNYARKLQASFGKHSVKCSRDV